MVLCLCPNPSVDKYVWAGDFKLGTTNRAKQEENFPGGKGVHVAMALSELGEDVLLLGFWGGPTGDWIRACCEEMGINCVGPETETWTRTCITFKSAGSLNETELLGTGPRITAEDYHNFQSLFLAKAADASLITMSGSWPHGAPDDAYAQLIKEANKMDKKCFLDCTGKQLKNSFREKPWLIHINEHEAKAFGINGTPAEMSLSLSAYCDYAALTAGSNGLYYSDGKKVVHALSKVEKVYSTVGSGDCLLAGLAHGFLQGMDDRQTAAMGAACGAANCLRQDLGMLFRTDVERLFRETVVGER